MSAASESGLPAVLAGRRRRSFVVLLAIAAAMAAVVVASAGLTQRVFDALVQGRQAIGAIGVEGLGLVALAAAGAVLRLVERVETERLGQDYVHELRQTVFDHLSRVSPRALQARGRGGIALRFTGDLSAMRQWVSLGLARLVVATVTLLLAALGLALLSPWLGLLVGSVLGVGAAVTGYLGRSIQGAVADARRARTRLANNVFEKVGAMGVVQAHGGAARERRRHGRQSRKLAGLMLRRAFAVGRLRAAVFGAAGTATAGSLVLGGWLVARGAMTPGGVVGAMVLVGLITPSMHDLGRVTEFWRGARVAREKLAELLAVRATVKNAAAVRRSGRIEGRIEFDGVVVRGALDGVSAVVEPGQTVALAGPSGAGKSTLLAAAARLVDVQAGTVRLDGIGIRKLSLGTLHRAVGIMSPDLPLLRGTLEDNLRYRLPDAPLAEFERVCRLCRVDELIATLADGLSTRIREGGGNLSLGQRRRVQLARAILGTPPILLLDEPTANLDLESKEAILDVVASYPGTVVVATHDRALCAAADAVWHLDDGRLIAEAPPASPPRAAPAARAAAGNDRAGVPVGRVLALGNGRDDPEALLYVPRDSGAAPALAVLVHGITRNAFEHVSAFRELAERRGVVLLAPLFLPERDRGYQRLASGIDGVAADIKLLRLVDRVAELVGAATERVFLFGFSGGAQFVHRFALRHPERVARLAVASAGWYTLPDEQLAFPLGLRGAGARLDEFLRLPQRVFVGDADVASDAGLNRTPEIEAAQGRTRVARAEHWVAALRAAAIERGLEPSVTLELLAGVGHSFADNARIGALARRTFDFFFATASQTVNR